MSHRIIYYYQTFQSLQPILVEKPIKVTHIHLSSFHFGTDSDNKPYIHLNDNHPDSPIFQSVWKEIKEAYDKQIKIIFMIGGAGGAFTDLFDNFETYYQLLIDTIKKYPYCNGIDLDVEEEVEYDNIVKLIKRIRADFGTDFIISMAPVSIALETDQPGMGGFSYKKLINSEVGDMINYFNGQFYGDFIESSYEQVIKNGYKPSKIVYGMLASDGPFSKILESIEILYKKYKDFGGVFVWEYYDAPPGGQKNPQEWSNQIYKILYPTYYNYYNHYYLNNMCNLL